MTALAISFCVAATLLGTDDPIEWGDTVKPGHAVWVRLLRLDRDDWLSVRSEFWPNQPSRLVVARSGDRCRNWRDLGSIEQAGRNLDNGLLYREGEQGALLLACRSVAVDRSSGRLVVFDSTDEGASWHERGTIDASEVEPGTIFGRGLWEPWLYTLDDGRLAAAYATERHSQEDPPYSQICGLRISEDGGRTWGEEKVLCREPGGGRLRPGMPIVVRQQAGCWLAVYEVVGVGDAQVFIKESVDGVRWPEGLGTAVQGHRAGPYLLRLEDGRLLLTSCTNRVSWSEDGGKTWRFLEGRAWVPEREPERTWLTWPALYQIGEKEVMATTSAMRGRPYELRFGTLRPAR